VIPPSGSGMSTVPVTYTIQGGDTTTTAAAGLAANLTANATLAAYGFTFSSLGAVVTCNLPTPGWTFTKSTTGTSVLTIAAGTPRLMIGLRGQFGTSAATHASASTVHQCVTVYYGGAGTYQNGLVSVQNGSVTVIAGGSGYANVGTGSFTVGFNDGVTIVNG